MPWELHELPAWVPLEILLRGEWAVTNAPSLVGVRRAGARLRLSISKQYNQYQCETKGVCSFRNILVEKKAEESFKFSIN